MRRKKWILIGGIVLAVGIVVYLRINAGKSNGYVFGTAQKRTLTEIITETGTISTDGRVSMYSPTNGVVGKVYVENGVEAEEGQKLFSVKSTATPQEKAAAFATYQAARSAVQQAENTRRGTTATVDRVHDDLKDKDKTESYLQKETRTAAEVANDNAYDTLLAAQASLKSAEAAYQATQNSTVTAPISGFVSNLSVASGSAVTLTSPVLIISSAGPVEIIVAIGESDVNKIKVGQQAAIKLDAVENKTYKGAVSRFDEWGSIVQGVIKFNVYINISDADNNIKPGMTADVDITTSEQADVLSVPNAAIKPYQKGRAVRKLIPNGQLEFIPVLIGIRGKEFTQIISGLDEKQEIVISLTNEKAERKSSFGF